MYPMRFQFLLAAFLMAASPFNAQDAPKLPAIPGLPQAARDAAASIDAEKTRAHVRFLSLDLLEGRGPGTRGAELAAEYIATQFAVAGVEPRAVTGLTSSACRFMPCIRPRIRRSLHLCRRMAACRSKLWYGDCRQGSDGSGNSRYRRADCVCGLWHSCAGVPLGRLCRP